MSASRPLFTAEHVPTQAEFELFARVSGDDNPIHVDAAFSARTRFGRTVAHGMFLYTLIWSRIRESLPSVCALEQTLKFPNPSYAGEALRLEATLEPAGPGLARISAIVSRVADGEVTCEAVTLVELEGRNA